MGLRRHSSGASSNDELIGALHSYAASPGASERSPLPAPPKHLKVSLSLHLMSQVCLLHLHKDCIVQFCTFNQFSFYSHVTFQHVGTTGRPEYFCTTLS